MRIIVVSPDEELCASIAHTLGATGALVDTFRTPGALSSADFDAAFYVIHFTDLLASSGGSAYLDRLGPAARVVLLLGRGSLGNLVDIMRGSDRVLGMFVADAVDHVALLALARRVLDGDRFGIDKLLPSAEVHTREVGYRERKAIGITVSKFLVKSGISKKHQIQIEQCLDEMLMNALYDAPHDADGNPVFGNVAARTRVTLRIATTITVQYAFDGKRVAISVRDNFGSLKRQTVLRVLYKCLHQSDSIDRKAGGAGVGLYLMVNASTAVYFNVTPGIETEAICCFDLGATGDQLQQLALTELPAPAGTRPAFTAADLQPVVMRRRLDWRLAVPIAALLVAGVALAIAKLGGSPSAPAKPAVVALDSVPSNAAVEIDGKLVGHTPLELSTLAPGARVEAQMRLLGYKDAQVALQVPARGQRTVHVEQLAASDEFVTVRVVSEPPGARVIQLGAAANAARTYTPAELVLKADTLHALALVMPGYAPLKLEPFEVERGAQNVEKSGRLEPGVAVRFTSKIAGSLEVTGDPVCRELTLPAECTLAHGSHTVTLAPAGQPPITKQIEVPPKATELAVEL